MPLFPNRKRLIGTILMIAGLVALIVHHTVHFHRMWWMAAYLVAFMVGMVVNYVGWREQSRQQKTH